MGVADDATGAPLQRLVVGDGEPQPEQQKASVAISAKARAEKAIPPEVLSLLREVYIDDGCLIWWNNRNRNLDRMAPRSLWHMSALDRGAVLNEAQRLAGGNWA